ncbi:MAG: tyrosine-type recombinase/integrase [Gaiellaceae bacterium]
MHAENKPNAGPRMKKTATPGIFHKGNRYYVVFRDPQGRQRKRAAHTLAEARTLKAALTADVKRSEYVEESRVSFADYARRWIETYDGRTARGIRANTLRDYRRTLGFDADGEPTGSGAVAYFGRMPLAAIRTQDVKGYAAEVAARGVARNTVRLAIAPVKALLATAQEEGLIRANPAAGLRLGRTVAASPLKETRALNEEEVVAVLAQVPEEHRLLAELLAQTGLRISEALALTKADVDFGRRRLSVSRRLYRGELDAPKSRHGVRQVPLSPGLARRLWKLLATADVDALVFATADGAPLDATRLYHVVHAAGERAGIEWSVGLHTFRHSCASIMFRRGVPKEAIRRLLGHHSWDFTAGTYVHLEDDDLPDGAIVGDLTASNVRWDAQAAPGKGAASTA